MPWYVLVPLVLLGLLLLLLPLRIGVRVTGQGGSFEIGIQLGGLTVYRIRPGGPPRVKSRKSRQKEQKKKADKAAAPKKEKEGPSLTELIRISEDIGFLLRQLLAGLSITKRRLLEKIVIDPCTLRLAVAGEDAMATTLSYGGLSAAVYGGAAALSHLVTLRRHDILLWPDYSRSEPDLTLELRGYLRLYHILSALFGYLAIAREVLALLKQRKAAWLAAEQEKAAREKVR